MTLLLLCMDLPGAKKVKKVQFLSPTSPIPNDTKDITYLLNID